MKSVQRVGGRHTQPKERAKYRRCNPARPKLSAARTPSELPCLDRHVIIHSREFFLTAPLLHRFPALEYSIRPSTRPWR